MAGGELQGASHGHRQGVQAAGGRRKVWTVQQQSWGLAAVEAVQQYRPGLSDYAGAAAQLLLRRQQAVAVLGMAGRWVVLLPQACCRLRVRPRVLVQQQLQGPQQRVVAGMVPAGLP